MTAPLGHVIVLRRRPDDDGDDVRAHAEILPSFYLLKGQDVRPKILNSRETKACIVYAHRMNNTFTAICLQVKNPEFPYWMECSVT